MKEHFKYPQWLMFLCRHVGMLVIVLISQLSALAQDKQSVQVKAFDQQLQPIGNIEISINENAYIALGKNGAAFTELLPGDLPIRSITIKNDQLEAASWIYTKGVVEITIRKKSYQMVTFAVKSNDNKPLARLRVTFKGKNSFSGVTGNDGNVQIPLALDDAITSVDQFTIPDYRIRGITTIDNSHIITAEKVNSATAPLNLRGRTDAEESTDDPRLANFSMAMVDSIQSLTVFYSIFKNYHIDEMDAATKKSIDDKFNDLVRQLQDSVSESGSTFVGSITNATLVEDDVRALVGQVRSEGDILIDQRMQFDEKIKILKSKLDGGISNLSEERRSQLLSELALLEQMLIENESRFFKNQNDYRDIINGIKEKYFQLTDLESKLSESEAQRLEEQRVFRERLLAISALVLIFGVLVLLLVYASYALRKQKKALAAANEEISRINENLEALVLRRTQLLAEAHKELDTFLYRASHDMRSPVCSIIGLCNIASHLSVGEPRELIDRVVNTTVGMDKLLKKLSVISEINQPTNFSAIRLRPMVEEIGQQSSDIAPHGKISFILNCLPDLEIRSYPSLVYTIFWNLIENSLYFGSLETTREPVVRVDVSIEYNHLNLAVYDNGPGVDPLINDRLFDMFFKGTEKSRGHGLGLYIVSKAVQALNGTIEVESELGAYSIFRVRLPLHDLPAKPHAVQELEAHEATLTA
jgi:signal transduction histidine kinase